MKKRGISEERDEHSGMGGKKFDGPNSIKNRKMMKKNMQRLGGSGLSLEAFANAKSRNNNYNPALIKRQREFYKNAKYVSKYKRQLKQREQQNNPSTTARPLEVENETEADGNVEYKKKKSKKNDRNLKELYEKKHEELEKARIEREAMIQAKKEAREKAEARRKAFKEKMFKKTRSGQPVMKYRIEHLLERIENDARRKKEEPS